VTAGSGKMLVMAALCSLRRPQAGLGPSLPVEPVLGPGTRQCPPSTLAGSSERRATLRARGPHDFPVVLSNQAEITCHQWREAR